MRSIINNSFEYEDLISAGNIGLVRALKDYDLNNKSGATFNTYAYYWVRSKIQQYLNFDQALIHIPVRKRDKFKIFVNGFSDRDSYEKLMSKAAKKYEEKDPVFSASLDRCGLANVLLPPHRRLHRPGKCRVRMFRTRLRHRWSWQGKEALDR